MQSGEIADSQLSASNYSVNFEPWHGRLNRWTGAWCTTEETLNQFLQIDLRDIKTVTHIATQGYFEGAWVKSYSLEYSADGEQWLKYKEAGGHKRVRTTILFFFILMFHRMNFNYGNFSDFFRYSDTPSSIKWRQILLFFCFYDNWLSTPRFISNAFFKFCRRNRCKSGQQKCKRKVILSPFYN